MCKINLLVFILFISTFGNAQNNSPLIDTVINSYYKRNTFSGSVLVAQKDKIILRKSYGKADREWNIDNTPETKFRIGSVSKQFTSMLVMQLYQSKKIDLQEKIIAYLPWFDKETGNKITIHHLLSNSSGLPNYTDFPNFLKETAIQQFNPLQFAKENFKTTLDFEPGIKYVYSNTNYFLLGLIIESVTNKPFEQVLQENILSPLQMTNSGIDYPDKVISKRANGYIYTFDGFINSGYINMASATFACGALYSTVDDLFLWHKGLNSEKLISNETKKIMFSPNIDNYAYGWIVRNISNFMGTGKSVTLQVHGGRINGFLALICRIPEEDVFITFLNNTRVANHADVLDNMLNNVVSALYNQPVSLAKPSPVYEMKHLIETKTINQAIEYYYQLKQHQKDNFDFGNIADLTNLAEYLTEKNRINDALEIYKLNADENPSSTIAVQTYVLKVAKQKSKNEAVKYLERSKLAENTKQKIQEEFEK
ncbi:MAG: serine hydrolase [Agriterribacter sp.]